MHQECWTGKFCQHFSRKPQQLEVEKVAVCFRWHPEAATEITSPNLSLQQRKRRHSQVRWFAKVAQLDSSDSWTRATFPNSHFKAVSASPRLSLLTNLPLKLRKTQNLVVCLSRYSSQSLTSESPWMPLKCRFLGFIQTYQIIQTYQMTSKPGYLHFHKLLTDSMHIPFENHRFRIYINRQVAHGRKWPLTYGIAEFILRIQSFIVSCCSSGQSHSELNGANDGSKSS